MGVYGPDANVVTPVVVSRATGDRGRHCDAVGPSIGYQKRRREVRGGGGERSRENRNRCRLSIRNDSKCRRGGAVPRRCCVVVTTS